MDSLDPTEAATLESSGMVQRLLDKHTGSLKDILPIIEDEIPPPPISEFKISERGYRR